MQYLIDIVGTCNLKCPSCPVGNFSNSEFEGDRRPKGFMELDRFERILDKATAESAARGEPVTVSLYNWGEALIHPRIAEFCLILQRRKIAFHISSNLNTEAPLKAIVRTNPSTFRISLSGFGQETYGRNHVGGDANLVISNMYRLRYAIDHCKSTMPVEVYYHVYRDNCDEDLLRMADLSAQLGFYFHPGWAFFMGMEKVLDHIAGQSHFSESDQAVLSRTVLTLDEELALAQQVQTPRCTFRTDQVVINHDGSVPLCCGTYDPKYTVASDFLAISHDDLQAIREPHELCGPCMKNGGMYLPTDIWDAMANRRQQELGQRVTTMMFAKPHVRIRQGAEPSKIKKAVARFIPIRPRP